MASLRMFVNDLKMTLDTIYNDYMHDVKNDFDPKNILLNTDIARDGSVMIINEIFGNSISYPNKSVKWEIKTDKVVVDLDRLRDFYEFFCPEIEHYHLISGFYEFFYPEIEHYNLTFEWSDFVQTMLESCVYFDAGQYGCLDLAKYEKDVQDRFEQLCWCSMISRHAHSKIIEPLKGPNMTHLI